MAIDRVRIRTAALVLATGLLVPADRAPAAPAPRNLNTWHVTSESGADIVVMANSLEIGAGGALVFTIILGNTPVVVRAFAPGFYKCVRATSLATNDKPSMIYHVDPPFPGDCK